MQRNRYKDNKLSRFRTRNVQSRYVLYFAMLLNFFPKNKLRFPLIISNYLTYFFPLDELKRARSGVNLLSGFRCTNFYKKNPSRSPFEGADSDEEYIPRNLPTLRDPVRFSSNWYDIFGNRRCLFGMMNIDLF